MEGSVEEPLAPTLGALAVPEILGDVGDHPRIENAFTVVRGITAAIEVDIGASEVHTDLLSHLLQRFQPLGQQHHIGCIDGRHGDGRYDGALVVRDGDDLLPVWLKYSADSTLLIFVRLVVRCVDP
jgi:hypothetical protein